MILSSPWPSRLLAPACALLLLCFTAACAGKKDAVPTGITEVDKFLYEKGTEALNKKRIFHEDGEKPTFTIARGCRDPIDDFPLEHQHH